MLNLRIVMLPVLLGAVFVTGCATTQPPLYQWQGFNQNVSAYLLDNKLSPDAQVQLMEANLQKIQVSGGAVPPGFYAHLGLLHGQQGNLDKFAQYLQYEKKQYPESEVFMDFLMRNFKKKGAI